jgi:hypothetical protein
MNLLLATLPDDAAQLPDWLERQLTGPDLPGVVAELIAVHGDRPASRSVRELLGPHKDAVLSGGLAVLPLTTIRTFLAHPRSLLELQELILESGSTYWDRRLTAPEITAAADRGRRRLGVALGWERLPEPAGAAMKWYRHPAVVALATAAAVLIAVYLTRPTGWGWNRPRIDSAGATASAHLMALADAAVEWKARPKNNPAALAQTLREMRDGCTRLLAAEHRQLAPPDRQWLAGKCLDWGRLLDQHLAELTANGKDWHEVRREADETVDRLIRALRERSEKTA